MPRKSASRASRASRTSRTSRKSAPVHNEHNEHNEHKEDMSDMSFLPIALSPSHIENYDIENRIDFLEYYHVCYNPHFLYPIDTTKMFTIKFKDNQSIDPFEMIYDHILKEYPSVQLYLLRIEDQEDQKEHIELKEYRKTGRGKKARNNYVATEESRIEDQFVTKVIFIENQQSNEFGHYGIIFYNSNTRIYSYFDSMVSYDDDVSSAYFDRFVLAFQSYFGGDKTVIIEEDDIYRECPNSSLEIIGGEIRLTNPYTEKFHNQLLEEKANEFYMNQTIMGVDTQNQYCFMWGFAYTFAKLNALSEENREKGWSQLFRKMTCERSVIPVCFIKFFSSFIVNWMGDKSVRSRIGKNRIFSYETLMDDYLFHYFYNSFISNSKVYRECFDATNDTFHLFINKKGLDVLNSGKIYTIHEIVDALFTFCDDEEYSKNVVIQDMPAKNRAFEIVDCRENKNKLIDQNVLKDITFEIINKNIPTRYRNSINQIKEKDSSILIFTFFLTHQTDKEKIKADIENMKNSLVENNLSTFTSFLRYNLYMIKVFCQLFGEDEEFTKESDEKIKIDCEYPYININAILQMLCDSTDMNDKIKIINYY